MGDAGQKGVRVVVAVTGWCGCPPGEAWRGRFAGDAIHQPRVMRWSAGGRLADWSRNRSRCRP
jgi:hypothetical protein